MAHGKRKQAGTSGSRKRAKQTFESWAAGSEDYRKLCGQISDGTVDEMHAAGLSHPKISEQLYPAHNKNSFNGAVKKARASIGDLVGKHLSFLFCFALIVISLVF
jgi:hypothetical protein